MNPSAVQSMTRIPELNRRILFAFAMLAVYRMGCAIPTPGIDPEVVSQAFEGGGGVFGLLNLFTGGALEQASIFALGIMPYITASIIFQLLTVVIPALEELKKEGEQGRRVITRYTRYATVVLALFQGMLMATGFEQNVFGVNAVTDPGWTFRLMTMLTLASGTAFIMWLGEQINERGIGNGISLIIFAGIVVRIPGAIQQLFTMVNTGLMTPIKLVLVLVFMVAVLAFIVWFERGQRRIPIQYARRVVGNRVLSGGMTYFPLRLNTSGVIPPIFATSLMVLPLQIAQWGDFTGMDAFISDYLSFGGVNYNLVFVTMIIFFAYFYTGVLIDPDDVAENIKKNGGYIPGIRPGKRTADYILRVLNRITLIGALYLAAVCVLPSMLAAQADVPFLYGGTALLIVVGVGMDTAGQIEAHLVARNYETFAQGTRIRGRRG